MDSVLSMLPLLVAAIVFLVPMLRITKRLGRHPAWAWLVIIPGGLIITLYVLAFSKGKQ